MRVRQAEQPRTLRVLIVEDHEDAAVAQAELLKMTGHAVRIAFDGFRALEIAPVFRPHVVLLDISLPVMDGHEVARRIRATSAIPMKIIAVTGWGAATDRDQATVAGFDDHLVKPVESCVLQSMLDTIKLDLTTTSPHLRPQSNGISAAASWMSPSPSKGDIR